jgi:hypothetical protein
LPHCGERELAGGSTQRGFERRPVTLFVLQIANELAISVFPLRVGSGFGHEISSGNCSSVCRPPGPEIEAIA